MIPMLPVRLDTAITPERLVEDWWAQPKMDGVRALADCRLRRITNRRGADISHRWPDVVEQLPKCDLIIDGELVAWDREGISFAAAHQRDATENPQRRYMEEHPGTIVAFDVAGVHAPIEDRVAMLADLELQVIPLGRPGEVEASAEGLVFKRRGSRYVEGRSPLWQKWKRLTVTSCLVTEMTAGEGERASTFGALVLKTFAGTDLVEVGKVGSGFTGRDLLLIRQLLDAGKPIVVDVRHSGWTSGGMLREPVFHSLRSDLDPHECTKWGE